MRKVVYTSNAADNTPTVISWLHSVQTLLIMRSERRQSWANTNTNTT